MKKINFSLVLFFAALQFSYAQWSESGTDIYNSNTGNVGIGTQTPASKLDVDGTLTLRSGNVAVNSIIPNRNVNGSSRTMRFNYSSSSTTEGFQFYNAYTSSNLMMITGLGKVGIGTQNPVNLLHISSNQTHTTQTIEVLRNGSTYGNATLLFGAPRSDSADGGTASGRGMIRVDGSATDNISTMYIGANTSGLSGIVDMDTRQSYLKIVGAALNTSSSYFEYKSGSTSIMRVGGDGNVGIGTTNPQGYKLAVNGSIHSKSVKVNLTGWPDFVFKKDYNLPTLTEVKNYIEKNQHLPDMPSADEVHNNGLDLGEMNRLLLKKVEELTLYLIEQKETTDGLKKQIEKLKKQIEE